MWTGEIEENPAQRTGPNLEIYLEMGLALEIDPDKREEETPVQVSGQNLEIDLGIGLVLDTHPDPEVDQGTGGIGTTVLEVVETPALDPIPEIYLVRDLGTEEEETKLINLDLEIYLGRGKGTPEPQALATDTEKAEEEIMTNPAMVIGEVPAKRPLVRGGLS